MRDASSGQTDAARMLIAYQALEAANEVLSGRFEARRLAPDLGSVLRVDYDNSVTRLCIAVLEVARKRSQGGDLAGQSDVFIKTMATEPPRRATLYRREWGSGWSDALRRHGLKSYISMKPSIQNIFGSGRPTVSTPTAALPKLTDAAFELARGLDSAGRGREARQIRDAIRSVLRGLLQTDGSVANTLLCADLLVRTTTADPEATESQRTALRRWRDNLRTTVDERVPAEPDWTDISRAPVWGSVGTYRWLLASFGEAVAAVLALAGMAVAWAFMSVQLFWGRGRAAPDDVSTAAPAARDGTWIRVLWAAVFGVVFAAMVWLVSIPISRGLPIWGPWWIAASAASFLGGVMLPFVLQPDLAKRRTLLWLISLIAFIGCMAAPFVAPIELVLVERFVRGHAVAVLLAAAATIVAGLVFWGRLRRVTNQRSTISSRQHLRVSVGLALSALICFFLAVRVHAIELDVYRSLYQAGPNEVTEFLKQERATSILRELDQCLGTSGLATSTSAPAAKL